MKSVTRANGKEDVTKCQKSLHKYFQRAQPSLITYLQFDASSRPILPEAEAENLHTKVYRLEVITLQWLPDVCLACKAHDTSRKDGTANTMADVVHIRLLW
jgi:hypothetical protein